SLQESIQPTPDGCNPFPEIPFQGMFSQAAIRSCGKPRVLHWKFARANKQFNDGHSEVLGKHSGGEATQMHHIFPRSVFFEIAAFVENIIALTPTQHLTLAHPCNNTSKVDLDFQYSCLLAKNETIRKNIMLSYGTPGFYSFDKLAFVLDVGFGTDYFQRIPQNDFAAVRSGIDAQFE
ncbi:MAG: hypothetical protein IJR99_01420, partial [Kiritimatiellae bacterium]|nr:hypothetical protein [Kiritimatiellia bacterium]